jgi:hypothetical protein
MTPGGELDVEKTASGKYRWTYATPGGAMYYGPKLYTRKTDARRAGQQWLTEQVCGVVS